jgi:hypothetical protein
VFLFGWLWRPAHTVQCHVVWNCAVSVKSSNLICICISQLQSTCTLCVVCYTIFITFSWRHKKLRGGSLYTFFLDVFWNAILIVTNCSLLHKILKWINPYNWNRISKIWLVYIAFNWYKASGFSKTNREHERESKTEIKKLCSKTECGEKWVDRRMANIMRSKVYKLCSSPTSPVQSGKGGWEWKNVDL